MAEMFYDDDADLSIIQGKKVAVIGYGSQGHAHALNLRDSGVDVRVGLAEGSKSKAKAEAEGLTVTSVADAVKEADLVVILTPDQVQRTVYAERHPAEPQGRRGAALRPRLQHPLRLHQARGRRRRAHGRPQGPRPHRAPRVRRRPWGARAPRRRAGRVGHGVGPRQVLRQGDRRPACRRHQDDLHRGDRDRPLRRAGRALRRREPARHVRLRDPRRGGLPARGRLLRVPPRAQAHRRPHDRGRHRQAALVGLRHGGVRRLRLRAARHRPARQGEHEGRPRRHPERHLRQALHRRPGRRRAGVQGRCARRAPSTRSRPPAASCAGSWRGSSRPTPTTSRAAPRADPSQRSDGRRPVRGDAGRSRVPRGPVSAR